MSKDQRPHLPADLSNGHLYKMGTWEAQLIPGIIFWTVDVWHNGRMVICKVYRREKAWRKYRDVVTMLLEALDEMPT